jgi:hypothetical protein
MSEPSSGVPSEIADADIETPDAQSDEPGRVSLDVDEEKLEAWDDIKSDYQVDPDGEPVPNSTETPDPTSPTAGDGDDHRDADGDGQGDEIEGTAPAPG